MYCCIVYWSSAVLLCLLNNNWKNTPPDSECASLSSFRLLFFFFLFLQLRTSRAKQFVYGAVPELFFCWPTCSAWPRHSIIHIACTIATLSSAVYHRQLVLHQFLVRWAVCPRAWDSHRRGDPFWEGCVLCVCLLFGTTPRKLLSKRAMIAAVTHAPRRRSCESAYESWSFRSRMFDISSSTQLHHQPGWACTGRLGPQYVLRQRTDWSIALLASFRAQLIGRGLVAFYKPQVGPFAWGLRWLFWAVVEIHRIRTRSYKEYHIWVI